MTRLRRFDGPLTRMLARAPGGFGLGQVPKDLVPERVVASVCGFCSTGCCLDIHIKGERAMNLTPTAGYPVNDGAACPKGWESLAPLGAPDRLTSPLIRNRHGELEPASWEQAIARMTEGFKAIAARHGPESVAFLSTGQIVTEEMALLGALAKFGMGMLHGDGNTRQCMATSVAAHKRAFGFDAPPYTYDDFEYSDTIVLIGSNLAIAHPILWERVSRNRDAALVVIDPRCTETASVADLHLQIRPKTDLVLLAGVARELIARGWVDWRFVEAHTAGFPELRQHVEAFRVERVVDETGVDRQQFDQFVDLFAPGRSVSLWWTMGVNQGHDAVATANGIINLALLTGNIGRPGTGANSITGQCNAMGSRLFSNTTNLFGGRDFADPKDRAEVATLLDIDVDRIPDRPSYAYDQIIEGIHRGTIRGLWIIATNSAHSWINNSELRSLLDRLELLVVQDLFGTTETVAHADVVLAAAGWGEKEGTFINSERRIGVVRRVAAPPVDAKSDFEIFRLVAQAWGCADMFREWTSPEAVFGILQRLSEGQPCDFSGIDGYAQLERVGGIQWPWPAERRGQDVPRVGRRLFGDGQFFTPDGRARFVVSDPVPPPERPDDRYPLVLLTGRGSAADWHTRTRTSKSATLRALTCREPVVDVHPNDARCRGIDDGDQVRVVSRRGVMRATAHLTPNVGEGQVFVSMHHAETNRLTFPAFDPVSRQPAYKYAAVEVERLRPGAG
ncbi:MAG: nitrate reductase [Acidimicrobiales bacterium]|nr:nitrate reductase [Acidimicrobiales bacterium]